jgi:hypothetical protein
MVDVEQPVRIYVGTDRSQLFAANVLEYSIRRHTDLAVEVTPLINVDLPVPQDPRLRQATGFSFARFAIPGLAGHRGRAIYMDADMMVFKDIRSLWTLPSRGAKVLLQGDLPDDRARIQKIAAPKRRIKQTSVMVLDCAALKWDAEAIVRGLDEGRYDYKQLMQQLCILPEEDISYVIPFEWNSLEYWDEATCLIHYTDMPTQPWVEANNPHGWLWVNELRRMVNEGRVRIADLEGEVRAGYFRPSLLTELQTFTDSRAIGPAQKEALMAEDAASGFVKHRMLMEQRAAREREIAVFMSAQAGKTSVLDRVARRFLGSR